MERIGGSASGSRVVRANGRNGTNLATVSEMTLPKTAGQCGTCILLAMFR
jgi:hypothetical protein